MIAQRVQWTTEHRKASLGCTMELKPNLRAIMWPIIILPDLLEFSMAHRRWFNDPRLSHWYLYYLLIYVLGASWGCLKMAQYIQASTLLGMTAMFILDKLAKSTENTRHLPCPPRWDGMCPGKTAHGVGSAGLSGLTGRAQNLRQQVNWWLIHCLVNRRHETHLV